jgi:ADP-ribose pyrophosphatase YjhB (NUDIX family)
MDVLARCAYRFAYVAARAWWFVRRPKTFGSVVALWNDGRLLLVRSSYRRQYTLPGGFLKRGEDPRQAALRELSEELSLLLPAAALALAWQGTRRFEYRDDTLTVWEVVLTDPPPVRVDDREIVWAGWKTPAEARRLPLLPHVREYLDGR